MGKILGAGAAEHRKREEWGGFPDWSGSVCNVSVSRLHDVGA